MDEEDPIAGCRGMFNAMVLVFIVALAVFDLVQCTANQVGEQTLGFLHTDLDHGAATVIGGRG